jgi:hypothetical protein
MAFYDEDQDEQEYAEEMQALIDSGAAWRLEGSVGRSAMSLITDGVCALGKDGHTDYWGNYVPSRYEVKSGTKGSEEYVKKHSPFGVVLS